MVQEPGAVEMMGRDYDRYDWFSEYLNRRQLLGFTRMLAGAGAASLGLIPLLMLFSAVPPRPPVGTTLAVLSGVCGLAGSLLFIRRWPTKNQSVVFSVVANLGVALGCLSQSNLDAGMHACTGFAVLAGYIALLHTTPLMVYNFCSAILVSAVVMTRLADSVGVLAAACAFAVVVIANLAAPFGIQIVVRTMGSDVLLGDYDPLTGLFTRRAFYRRTHRLGADVAPAGSHLCVAMVDLDRFKELNDQHGHASGDEVLVAVATALRRAAGPTAVLGRVGGEEFLVADVLAEPDWLQLAEVLRRSVAALPNQITASVGTATMAEPKCEDVHIEHVVKCLVATADEAMYEAKRMGGNQTRHRFGTALGATPT